MPEKILKFQPDRTVCLRGFNTFAAAASIHSASPTGFTVSGTFRDPADFAVAVLYDADNYFEHPGIKYLPDFDLSGLTLSFDLNYSDGLQPIDSPKYNWIDWATLDCIQEDGTPAQVRLLEHSMLVSSAFPAATTTCTLLTGSEVQPFDRATLWYQNLAFDYIVPEGNTTVEFTFFAHGTGTVHSITVNGTNYPYTETKPTGENGTDVANGLVSAIGSSDPYVTVGSSSNTVTLTVRAAHDGVSFPVGASDDNGPTTMRYTSPDFVATQIADQVNATDWAAANTPPHALMAAVSGPAITLTAARYGSATVSGTSVTIPPSATPVTVFAGITAGSPILIGGVLNMVATVQSPTQLTLQVPATVSGSGIAWVAPRGGHDGNLIELYSLSKTGTLYFDNAQYQLMGGSSNVTWNCTLDFSALGLNHVRQCWLTFAPALVTGTYTATEWDATFSNWQLTGPTATQQLQVAGPGSIRIEQSDRACQFSGTWSEEAGFYSKYFANVTPAPFSGLGPGSAIVIAGVTYTVVSVDSSLHLTLTAPAVDGTNLAWSALPSFSGLATVSGTSVTAGVWDPNAAVTITYICQFPHDLWVGTSLYSDRANAGVSVDGDAPTSLVCQLATGSAIVTRRQARTGIPAGKHTVTIRPTTPGFFYFNFLEAVVASDVPDALAPRTGISPALDFDTDHSYKLPPARLMWMMDKLGYAGPMNEYLGVFWWNQRRQTGATFSAAEVTFGGTFASGDAIFLTLNGTGVGKLVFPADTSATIAVHFAALINGAFVGVWASTAGPVLTITGRSADPAYTVSLTLSTTPAQGVTAGTAVISSAPVPGQDGTWIIDDTVSPPLNYASRAWHSDYYSQCATRSREVVTSCSLELVNPPAGYAAKFPDGTEVTTATGFGSLSSTQCAVGATNVLVYQKAVYRCIAGLQAAAGLAPNVQYGEFLWWYFAKAGVGMGYYDPETTAAALTALGRALHVFTGPNDDPTVNSGADSLFLRNRLRDHVAALVADIRSAHSNATCEVLWPYDVNYPSLIAEAGIGGQLNYSVNLPVEWRSQPSSGLDRMKVEALAFSTGLRDLNLAREAIELFPSFGWPLSKLRYLVPVFGSACPWIRELALALGAGITTNNLWAFDHICLFNLPVPEGNLERRSFAKRG